MGKVVRIVLFFVIAPSVLIVCAALTWLYWDANRPLDAYFAARHGELVETRTTESTYSGGQEAHYLALRSDSGLRVSLRVLRKTGPARTLPVLVVLGGHRTGRDAVDLFADAGDKAVVAIDYPYDGPEKIHGIRETVRTVPLARKALIDTPPAVSLSIDWILEQEWADPQQVVIVGASLGVPFAAISAALDRRISGAILVHGAADNLSWLEAQLARRISNKVLHRPLATVIHWLAYGPTFNTATNVAKISPRPVVIIGAREDERTPAGQTEALYAAAGQPKLLRWTAGQHIEPGRGDVIAELLEIADEVLPFSAEN
jgi:dienelactone hydrolase